MKKFLSIIRNLAHIGAGILVAGPDPRYQVAGAALALIATGASQSSATAPKLPDGTKLVVKPITGEVVTEVITKPQGYKPQIPLMVLIGALSFSVVGCGSTPEERFASAVDIVQTAAFNGTLVALHEHPEWKPFFDQAEQDLFLLSGQDNPSMAAIVAIVSRLPVDKLSSLSGQLLIGNGTLILQRYERKIDLSRENKRELISALLVGIKSANTPQP